MTLGLFRIRALCSAALAAGALCSPAQATSQDLRSTERQLPPPVARPVDFDMDVWPILEGHCVQCHGAEKQHGSLRLDRQSYVLRGGDLGPALVVGDSAASLLVRVVSGEVTGLEMPKDGPPLSPEQIGVLRAWIDAGASWPAPVKTPDEGDHWSFRPLVAPSIPLLPDSGWGANPIDAFVLARLTAEGMQPAPEADRRTLLRRVSFDLIGLPPTPEELDAFLADNSTSAYETVVDRLLASPRYGERFARHWMDVVHFAETHGHDQDRPRPNAWPYRDYLVRAFNDDTPYARFVYEQLAGDVLYPDEPRLIAATGLLAAGPWDESSLLNIADDTIDKQIARNLDRDDMLTTVASTFLSASVHCARCHHHKFDPISLQDYYNLQSVFAGVDRADRPFELDPQAAARRVELTRRSDELSSASPESFIDAAGEPSLNSAVAEWEGSRREPVVWNPMTLREARSAGGATATKLPDGSVLFSGAIPEKDTYTFVIECDLPNITGVRIETLFDPSLPQYGPGRQENGNLHLSEVLVQVAPDGEPDALRAVPLKAASADFDQDGWTAAMAIDGRPETAWGVFPRVGESHAIMLEFADRLDLGNRTLLTLTLEQQHGRGHLIGRPRFSATSSAEPLRLETLPEPVRLALDKPRDGRSAHERATIALHVARARLAAELASLPPAPFVYAAASDFKPEGNFKPAKEPRPVQYLRRGDVSAPMGLASPAGLACVRGIPSEFTGLDASREGSRRAALARWIADPRNGLAWRSIVNRIWHYHFGRGIVDTPNDLGRMGGEPTHPELLDWLATWLIERGGSLKQLHKLIVTSSTYRQLSQHNESYAARDAGNRWLWRMNRMRLDAESVRDAALQISGKLDLTMGGPSARQFVQSPGVHVTPKIDYASFDVDSPAGRRRSTYRFLFRTLPDPLMDALDCADASQLTPARAASVTALQALAMLNNRFLVRQSEHFAARLNESAADLPTQLLFAYKLALSREPTLREIDLLVAYARAHGLANACRVLLNSNEFMFVP